MDLDKNTILQILGSLMKNPSILSESEKYFLSPQDFTTPFEKYIFAAISNLYHNGAKRINVVDIDKYLSEHEAIYNSFIKNNGIEYLMDAEDISTASNFDFYYTKLKKYNAIKDLKMMGFDTSKIYPEGLLDNKEELLEKFDNMSVKDIFNSVKKDFSKVENKYSTNGDIEVIKATSNITELIGNLKNNPEVGINFQGDIFNTVVRGARKGKFYIRSGGTGTGKTRSMIGDACYMAYPIRYSNEEQKWVNLGNSEKVLYIGTEQKYDEIQTMILSYLSGINEEKILLGYFSPQEEELLNKAIKIMENYSENFIIARLPDPNIASIKAVIRDYSLREQVDNIFYDYIFSSPSLLNEFRDLRIREDVVLTMLSTALKDLAAELDIFIMSATQVNGEIENKKGIKDQTCLRGAKSIADKVDVGCITMKTTNEELTTLDALIRKTGIRPNQVTDIYKLRRGRYNSVRIWSYMDLGTCRKKDLFITDGNYNEINGFQTTQILIELKEVELVSSLLKLLNTGEASEEVIQEFSKKEIDIENVNKIQEFTPRKSIIAQNLI